MKKIILVVGCLLIFTPLAIFGYIKFEEKKNIENRKKENMKKVLEKRLEEEKIIYKYIQNNEIVFSKLPEIEGRDRGLWLRLLTKGRSKKREWNKSDVGLEYKIELEESKENIILRCTDGNLSMPPYKIVFRGSR